MTANGHQLVRLEFTSAFEMLDFVQVVSDHLARGVGLDEDSLHWVSVAIRESVINAIKHGNREIAEKKVHLDCRYSPTHVCIEIQDEGPGFNPANVPDCTDETHIELPCGRGLLLMRSFMNRVEYKGCGNVVVMEKTRDTASASAH